MDLEWVYRGIAAIVLLWAAEHYRLFDFAKWVFKREANATFWWFRRATFEQKLGWWLNSRPIRRLLLGVLQDFEPIEKDVIVRDRDMEGNVHIETFQVHLIELSEKDLRLRQKFLGTRRGGDEDSRRGRSSRGRNRDDDIQIQRVRQFNMEKSLFDWNFVYPRTEWVEGVGRRPHPKAQEPLPLNRDTIEALSGSTSEQINDLIDEINEPPDELPAVRDEETGEELEPAVESPTVAS